MDTKDLSAERHETTIGQLSGCAAEYDDSYRRE